MSDLLEPLLPRDDSGNPRSPSPLLSTQTSQMTAAGVMTCLDFVKESDIEKYYLGEIYKEQTFNPITGVLSAVRKLAGFHEFISYKFKYDVGGKQYTFVITFREINFKMLRNLFKKEYQKYHIRLSILPENDLKCERRRCSIKLTYDGSLEFPEDEGNEGSLNRNFTSIYKGQWVGDAIVRNMREKNDNEISQEIKAVVENIKGNMDKLGKILVDECGRFAQWLAQWLKESLPNPVGGGYTRKHKRLTRRHKCVLKRKRKCKKSYRKRKYCKSKKSRRLRISVRSRK